MATPTLADNFWDTFVVVETYPLTKSEKKSIKKAIAEFKKGKTIRWPTKQ